MLPHVDLLSALARDIVGHWRSQLARMLRSGDHETASRLANRILDERYPGRWRS